MNINIFWKILIIVAFAGYRGKLILILTTRLHLTVLGLIWAKIPTTKSTIDFRYNYDSMVRIFGSTKLSMTLGILKVS